MLSVAASSFGSPNMPAGVQHSFFWPGYIRLPFFVSSQLYEDGQASTVFRCMAAHSPSAFNTSPITHSCQTS